MPISRLVLGLEEKQLARLDHRSMIDLLYRDNVQVKHQDLKDVVALQPDVHGFQPKAPEQKTSSWRLSALVKHAIEAGFLRLSLIRQVCIQAQGPPSSTIGTAPIRIPCH